AGTLGSSYGFSETLVKVIPLVLAALAVAVPARIWLINVGGEGQLFVGALSATWAAIHLPGLPGWLLLPAMAALGFVGGGLWAARRNFDHALRRPVDVRRRRSGRSRRHGGGVRDPRTSQTQPVSRLRVLGLPDQLARRRQPGRHRRRVVRARGDRRGRRHLAD